MLLNILLTKKDQQVGQLYELMMAIKKHRTGGEDAGGDPTKTGESA